MSAVPGSVCDAVKLSGLPSLPVWFGPAFAVGATFVMTIGLVKEPLPLSSSVTVSVTWYVLLSA